MGCAMFHTVFYTEHQAAPGIEVGMRANERVERIWRLSGMKVPTKQPKRGGLWLDDGPVRVCGRNGITPCRRTTSCGSVLVTREVCVY